MQFTLLKLYAKIKSLAIDEQGQDLIEYALIVALVAFAATAGMNSLANGINTAFSGIAATLGTYIT
jgi:pilus assembly protein Flp/PilA